MITFKEMAEPVEGWCLEQVRNVRAHGGGGSRRYYEVFLFHPESRTTLSYSDAVLERAWQGAVSAALSRMSQAA